MNRQVKRLAKLRDNPNNVSFKELKTICDHYFGEARINGTSHIIYKTPWQGDPRINIQKSKDGKAKAYQVRQILKAIDKLKNFEVKS